MARAKSSGVGLYLLLTLSLSSVFYALLIGTGHLASAGGSYTFGLMWCPGLAAVLTCVLRGEPLARLGWRWGEWRWQWMSYLVPLAYAAVAYLIIWTTGLGGFGDAGFMEGLGKRLGWPEAALSPWFNAGAYFVILASVGMLQSVSSGLGEEIGWRGFLAPALAGRMGFTRGALLTGAIWGAWHLPILLFADYNAGTPWWFAITCFFVLTMSGSVIMTWLRLRSGSLWTAALVHGSHNLFIQGFFTPMTAPRGAVTPWAIDEFGFVLPLVMAVFAVYFWRRRGEVEPVVSA